MVNPWHLRDEAGLEFPDDIHREAARTERLVREAADHGGIEPELMDEFVSRRAKVLLALHAENGGSLPEETLRVWRESGAVDQRAVEIYLERIGQA